jgi:hypothetical protein
MLLTRNTYLPIFLEKPLFVTYLFFAKLPGANPSLPKKDSSYLAAIFLHPCFQKSLA